MPTFFYPTRQLDSTCTLVWQNLSCLDPTTVGFCCDPWRRLRLVIDGERLQRSSGREGLQLGGQTLELTPEATARAVSAESLAPYDWLWLWPWPPPAPPGPAVELSVPSALGSGPRRFALCAPTEEERAKLLRRLRDAVDMSHGPASPYASSRHPANEPGRHPANYLSHGPASPYAQWGFGDVLPSCS